MGDENFGVFQYRALRRVAVDLAVVFGFELVNQLADGEDEMDVETPEFGEDFGPVVDLAAEGGIDDGAIFWEGLQGDFVSAPMERE